MRYKSNEPSALSKIYDATISLIKEKNYNKISSSDVIKKSGVSRSTYYIYFKNVDQILIHICNDMFDHIFSHDLQKEKHHDFSHSEKEDLKHLTTHLFYHFLEDKDLVLAILNSGGSQIFLNQLRKRIRPLITSLVEQKIIGNNNVPDDIKIHQYINGYIALMQYYLRHANDLSPEIISDYYLQLVR